MLTGKELGSAIGAAIKLKGVTKAAVARHFGVKPPSISDWINRGNIDKAKLDELFSYFSSVVGPEHWGRTSETTQRWPATSAKQSIPNHYRPLVQQICDLAEHISDDGLNQLIGYARCLATTHAAIKAKPPLSA